jgi:hypothetical protein
MKLEEAAKIARNLMELHACGDCNLIFYPMPEPLGFQYRNVIGLSAPHCEMNDANCVADTILHEIAHMNTPGDLEHGPDWKVTAGRADALHEKTFLPEFDKFSADYKANRTLRANADRYLQKVLDILDQRIDEGWRGGVDYSFARNPRKENE